MAEVLEQEVLKMAGNVQALTEKAAKVDVLEAELKGAKGSIIVMKDAADKNQEALDKLIADSQNIKLADKAQTFEQVLEKQMAEKTDDIEKFLRKEKKYFDIEIDLKAVGTVSTANVTGTTNWGAIGRTGIIANPNTATHVRSLLNVLPADPANEFYFMKENGNGEGAPAPVVEGDLKPQFDLDLIEASVKFETIAGWMLLTNKALRNVRALTSFLNARVPEKLLDVEDQQILYGTGTTPQIKGILTSGNFVAGSAAGTTPLSEKIINDMSLLEDTHRRKATGITMRPADYYSFFKQKAAGSGEYDLPQGVAFVNGVLYILGVPVATTTALTANDYVVGDFRNGADLMIQEAMRLEFFREDSDNVRRNLTTLRIEETIALPVYGNNFFVKGSSAAA